MLKFVNILQRKMKMVTTRYLDYNEIEIKIYL